MLQSGRAYAANELAEELEVSRRTVFRDLNMLEMAHIPYFYDADRKGYRISRHFFLPPVNLTLPEALAILLLAGRLRGARHLPLMSHSAKAALKLESALPAPIRQHVGSILDRMSICLGPLSDHNSVEAIFEDLASAVAEQRICQMEYHSFHEGRMIRTEVHPLRLAFIGRAWYLIGHSAMHGEVRTFKVIRIKELTLTDRKFPSRDERDLEDYFGSAWRMIPEGKIHDVHLHFEPMVAGNVAEVQWHESQRIEWNEDGSLEFHVKVDGLREIAWWVLGYGDQVEVIAPAELRRRVSDTAAAMVGKYRRTEGSP
jgi:proteasome accessory factor B